MREIKTLIIVIIILALILCCKIFISTPQDTSKYSREDILQLVSKTTQYNNYYCDYILDGSAAIYKFKDNVLISNYIFTTMYIDYNSNEKFIINTETRRAIVNDSPAKITPLLYVSSLYELISDEDCKYKYIEEENYNGYDCIVIQIDGPEAKYKIWVDSESGFVVKSIENKGFISNTTEYNIKLNYVTAEEMEKPDLSRYTIKEN